MEVDGSEGRGHTSRVGDRPKTPEAASEAPELLFPSFVQSLVIPPLAAALLLDVANFSFCLFGLDEVFDTSTPVD